MNDELIIVSGPAPDDEWQGEIPVDGKPTPCYPINLNFGQLPTDVARYAASTMNPYEGFGFDPRTAGFWINSVPIWGIPRAKEHPRLHRYFLDWIAMDYGYGITNPPGAIVGVELVNGYVSIPPLRRDELVAAHIVLPEDGPHAYRKFWISPTYLVVEVVNFHQAIIRGFFEEYDIENEWLEESTNWAVVPESAIRIW